MNRIRSTFDQLKRAGRKALIPYITPEYPVRGATVPILRGLEQSGASMIEIGIPFSDPLADGPTIQRSSQIALQNGATIPTILDGVREFRTKSDLPLLLMGYVNPILRYGAERFLDACVDVGIDGLIVPDLPPEEAREIKQLADHCGISMVFLIAPTTSSERIKMVSELSSDFSYCVSVTGVTGARTRLGENGSLDSFLERVKKHATKPFVVGFGISRAEDVRRIWEWADGAVVGSALIEKLDSARTAEEAMQRASSFLRTLVQP
jgi:tryptophan synthase alpha chain